VLQSRDDSIAGRAVAEGGAVSLFINRMSLAETLYTFLVLSVLLLIFFMK